jgi:hypothetical protein
MCASGALGANLFEMFVFCGDEFLEGRSHSTNVATSFRLDSKSNNSMRKPTNAEIKCLSCRWCHYVTHLLVWMLCHHAWFAIQDSMLNGFAWWCCSAIV